MNAAAPKLLIAFLSVVAAPAAPALAEEPVEEPPFAPFNEAGMATVPQTLESADAGPTGDLPPPPPQGEARRWNAAISAGPGWLALRDAIGRDGQRAVALTARAGVVVGPQWNLVLGVDHARTRRGEATFAQTAATLGVQRFFLGRAYVGAGVGVGWIRESGVPDALSDGPGLALSAVLGVELLRRSSWALTTEASLAYAQYELEGWEMGGIRLGVVAF